MSVAGSEHSQQRPFPQPGAAHKSCTKHPTPAEALPLPALIFSLFLSVRQPQLSNFNFIHTAAITPSGSRRMNTNGPLDCFKCRSEPETCLHFVRSCSITLRLVEFPPNGSLLVPASAPGAWVRAEETWQWHRKGDVGTSSPDRNIYSFFMYINTCRLAWLRTPQGTARPPVRSWLSPQSTGAPLPHLSLLHCRRGWPQVCSEGTPTFRCIRAGNYSI